jgi:glycosyltransferase involved in cell wall biosynthesis
MTSDARRFGKDVLGPIVVDYLERLDQSVNFFSTQRGASTLFVARAGVRIRKLYELYLSRRKRKIPAGCHTFYVSRFLITKALWAKAPDAFFGMISKEFEWQNVGQIVAAILDRSPSTLAGVVFTNDEDNTPCSGFPVWLNGSSHAAAVVRGYLQSQAELFERYLGDVTADADVALLVDSGWQGTCQKLLHLGWGDEIEWWGAYFGKSFFADSDRSFSWRMIGLSFEADRFDPFTPSSAFIAHRHVIEHLFEPLGRSVEQLVEGGGSVLGDTAEVLSSERPSEADSAMYLGVVDYITSLDQPVSRARIVERGSLASRKLAGSVFFPDKEEALLLGGYDRSADFGKNLDVPIVLVRREPSDGSPEDRIAASLWRAGQIALEYSGDTARVRQQQELGHKINRKQLEYLGSPGAKVGVKESKQNAGSVAVIMRTMDRRAFLRRALESVALQSYPNYQLMVVCDGGDVGAAEEEIRSSSLDPRKVTLIDNVINRGMEASSNIGISLSESDYVVIHDDDDSWEASFLEKCVRYLERRREYGGVITHSWHISEEVTGDGIVVRDKFPYNGWVQNVQLMEMACGNFFPPIGFVFRRSICSQLNGYDANFPVLGDWDFNIRFLELADIGVISEKLANYHHRDVGNKHIFSNSVVGEISKHSEYNSLMRNKLLRDSAHRSTGVLVGLGHVLDDLRREVRMLKHETSVPLALGSGASDQDLAVAHFSDHLWVFLHSVSVSCNEHGGELRRANSIIDELTAHSDLRWVADHAAHVNKLKFPKSWN